MTSDKRQNMIDVALSFVGATEGSKSHKAIVDTYNKIEPLPRGYKLKDTDAWCAAFVSACAAISGNLDAIPAECGCPEMIKAFDKRKEYYSTAAPVPEVIPGSIVFYDWNGDRVADHVGIVVKVPDNTSIQVCEGNYNNGVGLRHIGKLNKNILGYAFPAYAVSVPAWKTEAIQFCKKWKISDGENPDKPASRVEVMAMCERTVKAIVNMFEQAYEESKKGE